VSAVACNKASADSADDAELLALATQYDLLKSIADKASVIAYELARQNQNPSEDFDELDRAISEQVEKIVKKMAALPFHTLAGLRAKAKAAQWETVSDSYCIDEDDTEYTGSRLSQQVFAFLAGEDPLKAYRQQPRPRAE
jgi:hypothetical protein